MIEVLKQAVEALVVKQYAELESQEPVALPCCGYTDASAVKWNPLNGVVQCHNCGQNYTTSQRTEPVFCEYCGGNDENPPDHCMDCARPQRTWVGLTKDEQSFIYDQVKQIVNSKPFWVRFADSIEAKLKEKNT
jgi:hypothetical protein